MECFDLDTILKSGHHSRPDGLCPACQPMFDIIFKGDAQKCQNHRLGPEPHLHTQIAYHANKSTCPGCRLITSLFPITMYGTDGVPPGLLIEESDYGISDAASDTERYHGGGLDVFIDDGYSKELIGRLLTTGDPEDAVQTSNADVYWDRRSFYGRIVPPTINLDLVRSWMQSCDSHHEECRHLAKKMPAPFRLIDLEHFQVIEATAGYRYVALSYVWGRDMEPLLMQENLFNFSQRGGIRQADIPQTILDAMQVSRDLAYRYMWVDSICIIQNDANDKKTQLAVMGKIYSDADLVIVAATGNSAHTGLAGVGGTLRNQWQQVESLGQWQFITTDPRVPKVVGSTHWNSRGWTFQEAYLARRILFFAPSQVFWICQYTTWREDTRLDTTCQTSESSGLDSLWGSDKEYDGTIVEVRCRTREYCRNVEIFSKRTFKDESDTLWAYIGVLGAQAASFPQGYIWGVPYELLDVALLWTSSTRYECDCIIQETLQGRLARGLTRDSLPYPVPSWAWLSTRSGVKFLTLCGSLISEVTWFPPVDLRSHHRLGTWYFVWMHLSRVLPTWFSFPSQSNVDPADVLMDFKFLHFSAKTANLLVKLTGEEKDRDVSGTDNESSVMGSWSKNPLDLGALRKIMPSPGGFWDLRDNDSNCIRFKIASILVSGEIVGQLDIPEDYLRHDSETLGQFVLLSSNTEHKVDNRCKLSSSPLDCGNIVHMQDCDHIISHNVMLIEWRGSIAYRRALGVISKDNWAKVKVETKDIILG